MAPTMLRLHTLDPEEVAREAALGVMRRMHVLCHALGMAPPTPHVAEATPFYRQVLQLAMYAVREKPVTGQRPVAERVRDVAETLGEDVTRLTQGEPDSALEAVLQSAIARDKLDHGKALVASELALLAGYDRDSILGLAERVPGAHRAVALPRAPWRFRAGSALRAWIAERAERER
jgi:hypothetical protein